jgi:hypothetical protein
MYKESLEEVFQRNPDPFLEQLKISVDDINERRLKGYMYDSLCLRYKIAREAQARYEVNTHHNGDMGKAIEAAKKDEVRFYQILDDAIGAHF